MITTENGLRIPLDERNSESTLPSLDACKKIDSWINDPPFAAWRAALAPLMVRIQSKMAAKSFFIRKIFSLYFDGELILVIISCLGSWLRKIGNRYLSD